MCMVQELLVLIAAPSSCGREMKGLSNPYSSSEPSSGAGGRDRTSESPFQRLRWNSAWSN